MKDILQDIVKHTHGLGFLDLVKISGDDKETAIDSMAEDRSVILQGTFNKPQAEMSGTFGMPQLGKLDIHLKCPEYKDKAKITVLSGERNGATVPTGIHFENEKGDFKNDYRFMNAEIINEKLKTVKFKGVNWDLTVQPTQQNLKDLSYWAGVMGSVESTFVAKTDKGSLKFYIGDGSNDRVEIPFTANVNVELKKGWSWPLAQTLSILKLSDTSQASISFSEQGAMKISIDSGTGVYDYILPARTSS